MGATEGSTTHAMEPGQCAGSLHGTQDPSVGAPSSSLDGDPATPPSGHQLRLLRIRYRQPPLGRSSSSAKHLQRASRLLTLSSLGMTVFPSVPSFSRVWYHPRESREEREGPRPSRSGGGLRSPAASGYRSREDSTRRVYSPVIS